MLTELISLTLGFFIGLFTNYIYDKLKYRFIKNFHENVSHVLNDFESWTTDGRDMFYYAKDPDYKIEITEGLDCLSERFKKFPDRGNDKISRVKVKYKEAILLGWNFMHLDGYRYLIPVPRSEIDTNGEYYDFYDLKKPEIGVYKVIGEVDYFGNSTKIDGLKKVAEHLGISIVNQ